MCFVLCALCFVLCALSFVLCALGEPKCKALSTKIKDLITEFLADHEPAHAAVHDPDPDAAEFPAQDIRAVAR